MRPPTSRLLAVAVLVAALTAAVGFAWEYATFGSRDTEAHRVESDVRARVAGLVTRVTALADRASAERSLLAQADAADGGPARLFDRLAALASDAGADPAVSLTVYAADAGRYRVLAWSEGPADDLPVDRLAGPAALFVARRVRGLTLVAVRPSTVNDRRVVVAAECVVAVTRPRMGAEVFEIDSLAGPLPVTPAFGAATDARRPGGFTVSADADTPLIDVVIPAGQTDAERGDIRRRSFALAGIPLLVVIVLLTGRALDARARARRTSQAVVWSLAATACLAAATGAVTLMARPFGAGELVFEALGSLFVFLLVVIWFGAWWWRPAARRAVGRRTPQWWLEQLLAGLAVAAIIEAAAWALSLRLTGQHINEWQFPLFPIEAAGTLFLSGVLLIELAAWWAVAAMLGALAVRWRINWRHPDRAAIAAALWLAPLVIDAGRTAGLRRGSLPAFITAAAAAVAFALFSAMLRRTYRRTTQAARLLMGLGALLIPAFAFYPLAAFDVRHSIEQLVEERYAPAAANHTKTLIEALSRAKDDIDRLEAGLLDGLVEAPPDTSRGPVSGHAAYEVWRRTNLSQLRVTSAVELYNRAGVLVSRFALSVPEYLNRATTQPWQGASCKWDVFHEVDHFGAEDRQMLHAERGLCDQDHHVIGGVVIHVARDYRTLPFLAPTNPLYQVLDDGSDANTWPRLPDVHLVVYGWAFHPIVPVGSIAWPISPSLANQLVASRAGRWEVLQAEGRDYRVYFSNNTEGVYAVGYLAPTLLDHLTRLAAAVALLSIGFVIVLVAAAGYAPFAGGRTAPVRVLLDEIRTSFFRKLFLFFVLAAIGPVVMLALAFNEYTTGKFQADVESEARSVAAVARRVIEELTPDQPRLALTDDVLVWTGRVLSQDVNLFEGPRLVATSQRDVYESYLVPRRTPANVYRAVVLERLPDYVTTDRTFGYLVAAAPVPVRGRDALLTVPLTSRQREIEQQIDALDRGLLMGAVFVVLLAAGLGASLATRMADPVRRLTRATRQIAAGDLDVRIVADTADELRRLVDDFNSMAATLRQQREELVRSNQFKAWAQMARQVAHEIKNPLTPIQLAAEHLQRVHEDQKRPLGPIFDQCVTTILKQVRLLRVIAGEFANYAGEPVARLTDVAVAELIEEVLAPYRAGGSNRVRLVARAAANLPLVRIDRTLVGRALTNLVENAWQAMPEGGTLTVDAVAETNAVRVTVTDTGVGMEPDVLARAFEPYFSTKTAGSGLGLANAKRNIELCGGAVDIASTRGQGTKVTFTLPTGAAHGAPESATPPAR